MATQVPDLTCAETDYTGQQIILGRASNKLSCIDMLRGKITGDVRAPPLPHSLSAHSTTRGKCGTRER